VTLVINASGFCLEGILIFREHYSGSQAAVGLSLTFPTNN